MYTKKPMHHHRRLIVPGPAAVEGIRFSTTRRCTLIVRARVSRRPPVDYATRGSVHAGIRTAIIPLSSRTSSRSVGNDIRNARARNRLAAFCTSIAVDFFKTLKKILFFRPVVFFANVFETDFFFAKQFGKSVFGHDGRRVRRTPVTERIARKNA